MDQCVRSKLCGWNLISVSIATPFKTKEKIFRMFSEEWDKVGIWKDHTGTIDKRLQIENKSIIIPFQKGQNSY